MIIPGGGGVGLPCSGLYRVLYAIVLPDGPCSVCRVRSGVDGEVVFFSLLPARWLRASVLSLIRRSCQMRLSICQSARPQLRDSDETSGIWLNLLSRQPRITVTRSFRGLGLQLVGFPFFNRRCGLKTAVDAGASPFQVSLEDSPGHRTHS